MRWGIKHIATVWQFVIVLSWFTAPDIFNLTVSKQPENKGLNRLEADTHTHTHTHTYTHTHTHTECANFLL